MFFGGSIHSLPQDRSWRERFHADGEVVSGRILCDWIQQLEELKQRVGVPTASAFQLFNVLAPNRLLQLQRRVVQLGAIKFLILR